MQRCMFYNFNLTLSLWLCLCDFWILPIYEGNVGVIISEEITLSSQDRTIITVCQLPPHSSPAIFWEVFSLLHIPFDWCLTNSFLRFSDLSSIISIRLIEIHLFNLLFKSNAFLKIKFVTVMFIWCKPLWKLLQSIIWAIQLIGYLYMYCLGHTARILLWYDITGCCVITILFLGHWFQPFLVSFMPAVF